MNYWYLGIWYSAQWTYNWKFISLHNFSILYLKALICINQYSVWVKIKNWLDNQTIHQLVAFFKTPLRLEDLLRGGTYWITFNATSLALHHVWYSTKKNYWSQSVAQTNLTETIYKTFPTHFLSVHCPMLLLSST